MANVESQPDKFVDADGNPYPADMVFYRPEKHGADLEDFEAFKNKDICKKAYPDSDIKEVTGKELEHPKFIDNEFVFENGGTVRTRKEKEGKITPNSAYGDAVFSNKDTALKYSETYIGPSNTKGAGAVVKYEGKYIVTSNPRAERFIKQGGIEIGYGGREKLEEPKFEGFADIEILDGHEASYYKAGIDNLKEVQKMANRAGAKDFIDITGMILNYGNGSYLIELKEFVKISNGKNAYKPIKTYNGYDVKFHKNGVDYFSVWKGNKNLEDRITSIKGAEKIIDEFVGKTDKYQEPAFDGFADIEILNGHEASYYKAGSVANEDVRTFKRGEIFKNVKIFPQEEGYVEVAFPNEDVALLIKEDLRISFYPGAKKFEAGGKIVDEVEKVISKVKEVFKEFSRTDKELERFTFDRIRKLVDAGYAEDEIVSICLGYGANHEIKCDNELQYSVGLTSVRDESIDGLIDKFVKNANDGTYELGLKYPEFSWVGIIKKYSISTSPQKITVHDEFATSIFEIFIGNNIVIGHKISRKRNDGDEFIESAAPVNNTGKFNDGYWGIVSHNKKIIEDVAAKLVEQIDGYVKDLDIFINRLGGIDLNDLEKAGIKFETGGAIAEEPTVATNQGFDWTDFSINKLNDYLSTKEGISISHAVKGAQNLTWEPQSEDFIAISDGSFTVPDESKVTFNDSGEKLVVTIDVFPKEFGFNELYLHQIALVSQDNQNGLRELAGDLIEYGDGGKVKAKEEIGGRGWEGYEKGDRLKPADIGKLKKGDIILGESTQFGGTARNAYKVTETAADLEKWHGPNKMIRYQYIKSPNLNTDMSLWNHDLDSPRQKYWIGVKKAKTHEDGGEVSDNGYVKFIANSLGTADFFAEKMELTDYDVSQSENIFSIKIPAGKRAGNFIDEIQSELSINLLDIGKWETPEEKWHGPSADLIDSLTVDGCIAKKLPNANTWEVLYKISDDEFALAETTESFLNDLIDKKFGSDPERLNQTFIGKLYLLMDDLGYAEIFGKNNKEILDIDEVNERLSQYKHGGHPAKKKLWIKDALKHKGTVRRKAKEMGLITGDEPLTEQHLKTIKKLGGVWVERINLAQRLIDMDKNEESK